MTYSQQAAPVEQRAIDQWAQRMLKNQHDAVASEPVPAELIALIQQFPTH